MAVIRIKHSLKKRNEKALEQRTAKEEIAEIQDALLEIAEIVSAMGGAEQSEESEVGEDG